VRHALIILLAAVAPAAALAQQASSAEVDAMSEIAECLAEGLPTDWRQAHMIVELPEPGATSGNVQYLVARGEIKDKLEPFTPCDVGKPARALIDMRQTQPSERRGWTTAHIVLNPDGSFELNYDFSRAQESQGKK
jgi:hypothetical protein